MASPLTPEQWNNLTELIRKEGVAIIQVPYHTYDFYERMLEPWPMTVEYAGRDRPIFIERTRFYLGLNLGPSASTWMIPGAFHG